MIKRVVVLQGALLGVLALGSCKSDPTNTDVGTAAAVAMEFKLRTMAVGDSVRSFAQVVDKFSHPLQQSATIATACTPGILSVGAASDAPQLRTAFIVRAVAYGTSCVVATAGGFADTLTVTTVPASLVITSGPDTIASGATGAYTFAYRDANGNDLTGVPDPTLASADTTIAQPGAILGQVSGRSAGTVAIKFTGTAGLTATKTISIIVTATFTGTTSSPVLPGAFITIYANAAGPKFDANTATSLGAIDAATRTGDSIKVRISDVGSVGAKSFRLTGVGAGDVEYDGIAYTVNVPPAFTGTFTPNPVFPGATVWMHRDAADPVFVATVPPGGAGATRVARGTSQSNFSAPGGVLTVDTSTVRPDSFKFTISDLAAAGTYLIRTTRLGATNDARNGSYVLPVGTYGGTLTPGSGNPTDAIVLHRGGGDPQFDADTRAYFDGIRTYVDQFSSDTAVVIVPPVEHTGSVDLRLSRMGVAQQAEDALAAFTSNTASPLDPSGHNNETPNKPLAFTTNGNHYLTFSGGCVGTGVGGVASSGGDHCDEYYTVKNTTGAPISVTVSLSVFNAADIDFYVCDGTSLTDADPLTFPDCGTVGSGGDILSSAGAAHGSGAPETNTFSIPAGATRELWFNEFDANGTTSVVTQIVISGLP